MGLKKYKETNVYDASMERVNYVFDNFEKIYVSFSGGKDSSVMSHIVLSEAKQRGRKVGLLFIDMEAQYKTTVDHIYRLIDEYIDNIELYWLCLPLSLRNAVSSFEPRWICWDQDKKVDWVRDMPKIAISEHNCPFNFVKGMEFEELMVEFGEWYSSGTNTAAFIGIRCDESLNRFRTIANNKKEMFQNKRFTTKVIEGLYNIYPLYDWKTEDIWRFFAKFPEFNFNMVYEYMNKAGVPISQQRLCQPYGDDQKRGLWLYHIIEPDTWYKLISRVNGVNSGALYVRENGNISGYNKISKPEGHTWKTFCFLLLRSLPAVQSRHYIEKFKTFIGWWKKRGYSEFIPDESPLELEAKKLAPSYRRLCKVLLRNDYWCKGLNFSQPKSEAYGKYLMIKRSYAKQKRSN